MNPHDVSRLRDALAGRYALEGELGRGGMAVVFRARDVRHDRTVAVKVLRPDLARALGPDRFLREIKVTAGLNHPHILPLLDSGQADELLYYVMPYVDGESLRDRLERERRLGLDDALRIVREVADGLASAHRHGVVHRDIKPENILLTEGHAVISDFGVARAVAESADDRLTATGLAIGTPVYMSPEQVRGETDLDGRSDLYALGCMLYEMLIGEPPFTGPTVEAAIASRFTDAAPRIRAARPEVPEHVDAAVHRALEEDPDRRFASTEDFAGALTAAGWTTPPAGVDARTLLNLARTPRITLPVIVLVLIAIALVVVPARRRAAREHATALLPEISRLIEEGQYATAYDLAVRAEDALGGDTTLTRLMARAADRFTITTNPPGAGVWLQGFGPDGAPSPDSLFAGESPVTDLRVPRSDYRIVLRKDGFAPLERMGSSERDRMVTLVDSAGPTTLAFDLVPADRVPADMVFVPGGEYAIANPSAPTGMATVLRDFLLDRHEVTNAQYAAFIRGGGYTTPALWTPFRSAAGATLAELRDRTGMPAPRGWSGQQFSRGEDDHPVTGVSWYEAAAYCASVDKRLPTLFEWDKASRDGNTAGLGILMPWGLTPETESAPRANFGSGGTEPVDRYPFGISPYGAYAMAGNVKEWLANPMGDGHVVTGGSWEDPPYVYAQFGPLPRLAAAPTVGFRCARTAGPDTGDQGAARLVNNQETPTYHPVDAATFRSLLGHYRYDPRPLNPVVTGTAESADWIRTRIRYVATEGDTAIAYLFLPHGARPPYQIIVYVASAGGFRHPVSTEVEWVIGPVIRSGRAVFAVVFRGMVEREWPAGWTPPPPPSVRFRDLMVLHATEMRRGIDYLATRDDIDLERLAYLGVSWGAGSRSVFAGVDDRFSAVVLIGGGIDERVQPTLPEAGNINFLPHIRPPKLLINGTSDEEHPWRTRGLALWNLLREPKELVLVEGGSHVVPPESRIPAINRFLDRVLGPVRPDR